MGTACPAEGGFLPESDVRGLVPGFEGPLVHIRDNAGTGGDGGAEAPFATLQAAFSAPPPPGAVIVLAPGSYEADGGTPAGIAVVGSCASGTTISSRPRATNGGLLRWSGEGRAAVANVTLEPRGVGVVVEVAAGPVHVASVVVERAHGAALAFMAGARGGSLVDVVIRNLQPDRRTGTGMGVLVREGHVRLERVLIERGVGTGVVVESPGGLRPRTDCVDLVVSDLLPADWPEATGLRVRQGATLTARRLVVERVRGHGIVARGDHGQPPAELEVEDAVIRDLLSPRGPARAIGIGLEMGVVASLRRVGLARVPDIGLFANAHNPQAEPEERPVRVDAEDLRITELGPAAEAPFSDGILAQSGAELLARRVVIDGTLGHAIRLVDTASLELEDAAISNTMPSPRLTGDRHIGGQGVAAFDGPAASLTRVVIDGGREMGVMAGAEGESRTSLRLADVAVRDVRAQLTAMAAGVAVFDGCEATLERVRITDTVGSGLFVARFFEEIAPPTVTVQDLLIEDVLTGTDGRNGAGLMLFEGVRLTGSRVTIERAPGVGLSARSTDPAFGAPEVELEDIVVRATHSTELAGLFGHGVEAADGASVVLRRALIEGNRRAGVLAGGWDQTPQTRVALEDVVIRDTSAAACSELPAEHEHSCNVAGRNEGGGSALAALDGARVNARGFLLTGSALAGLLLARDGWGRLQRGRITKNDVGVNLLVPSFDTEHIAYQVFVYDNRLDTATLEVPLPEPARMVGALTLP